MSEDIKIVGWDEEQSSQQGAMFLVLSAHPTERWADKFTTTEKSTIQTGRPHPQIVGHSMLMRCSPEDLKRYMPYLKEVVAKTNAAIAEEDVRVDEARRTAEAQAEAQANELKQRIQEAKKGLDFD